MQSDNKYVAMMREEGFRVRFLAETLIPKGSRAAKIAEAAEWQAAAEAFEALVEALLYIRDNYEHDADGHFARDKTQTCRSCSAAAALKKADVK